MQSLSIIIVIGLIVFLVYHIVNQPFGLPGGSIPVSNVISHWSHFFASFAFSSDSFYKELQKVLETHEMPNVAMGRIRHKEGGILSANREYLRIKHGDIVFDVCAAPFGKDFFISWWLYETQTGMRRMLRNTRVGTFLQARAQKRTFYQIDEEDMFRSCVHECILEAVEKVSDGKGHLKLTEADKAFKMGGG